MLGVGGRECEVCRIVGWRCVAGLGRRFVNLGAIATRGERGTLIVSIDSLARMSSNPFFDYVMQRIDEGLGAPARPKP